MSDRYKLTKSLSLGLLSAIFLALWTATLAWSLGPASDWREVQNLSQSQAPRRSIQATLAQSPVNGDLIAVWTKDGPDEEGEILGRRWDRASQSWLPGLASPAEDLSRSQWVDKGPAVFYDPQGQAHLLWTRRKAASAGAPADATELMWRTWNGAAWSPEVVLLHNDSYFPGNYSFIPIETPDSILLFLVFDVGYRIAEYKNGSWSAFTPWAYLDVALADAVMDETGLVHAAAFGENSSNLGFDPWFYDAYYLLYNGSSWTQEMNVAGTRGVAHDMGLAFDGEGNLHFLWSDPDSVYSSESLKSAIWERVWNGSTWSANAEVTAYNEDQAISDFDLTSDASDTLHLAWGEGTIVSNTHTELDIYYQTGMGTNWGAEEKVFTSTLDSRYPDLAITDGVSLLWQEGPLEDRDVFFTRQITQEVCVGLTQVSIEGPATGPAGKAQSFTASSGPLTATVPVTYTWQASEQPVIVHVSGLLDAVDLTWATSGTQSITLTAENCGALVTAQHTITIESVVFERTYLPWLLKGSSP